jgi:hypothetical protein
MTKDQRVDILTKPLRVRLISFWEENYRILVPIGNDTVA